MSLLTLPIFKTEDGTQNHPAVNGSYNTHCDGGVEGPKAKVFEEVYIHWNGAAWARDNVFVPNQSIVALKVTNICDDTFAYVDYPYNDFRIDQLCCRETTLQIFAVIDSESYVVGQTNQSVDVLLGCEAVGYLIDETLSLEDIAAALPGSPPVALTLLGVLQQIVDYYNQYYQLNFGQDGHFTLVGNDVIFVPFNPPLNKQPDVTECETVIFTIRIYINA